MKSELEKKEKIIKVKTEVVHTQHEKVLELESQVKEIKETCAAQEKGIAEKEFYYYSFTYELIFP